MVRCGARALKIGVHSHFDPNFHVGIDTFYPEKFRLAYCTAMWFIVVMHFQMGGFAIVVSCNFIKEFLKSCVLFGLSKPIWNIV